jgi:hypothetical protein
MHAGENEVHRVHKKNVLPFKFKLAITPQTPADCSIYYSRTFGTLFWNDIKWSAHGVLEHV